MGGMGVEEMKLKDCDQHTRLIEKIKAVYAPHPHSIISIRKIKRALFLKKTLHSFFCRMKMSK